MISRLLQIIGLFRKRALQKRRYCAKDKYCQPYYLSLARQPFTSTGTDVYNIFLVHRMVDFVTPAGTDV